MGALIGVAVALVLASLLVVERRSRIGARKEPTLLLVWAAVLITVAAAEAVVTVGVHDRGPGISPEHAQHIFDRFYRINDARIRNTGGIGLGLAISRGLVEAHGGHLWLDNQPAQGSTFYFSIPIARAELLSDRGTEAVESLEMI